MLADPIARNQLSAGRMAQRISFEGLVPSGSDSTMPLERVQTLPKGPVTVSLRVDTSDPISGPY